MGTLRPDGAGEAEVEHLDCTVGAQLDIGGLQVPMNDPVLDEREFQELFDRLWDDE